MYPQYQQPGYTLGQPMQMQYPQQQMMYQPPQQQVYQTYPQVTNYPTTNQPMNVGQSGVSFDQIRQALANYITQRVNNDAFARQVYVNTRGPEHMPAFMTGSMDKLVQTFNMILNVTASERQGMPFDQVFQTALDEVYGCAWAKISQDYPHLNSDPSMAGKQQLINTFLHLINARNQQLTQSGMLNNNAPVNPMSVPGGYPSMNVNYANIPQQAGQFGVVSNPQYQQGINQQMLNRGQVNQPVSQTGSLGADYHATLDPVDAYIAANNNASYTGPRDKYGFPIGNTTESTPVQNNVAPAVEVETNTPQNTMPYANTLGTINQVPERQSILPKQPGEVYQAKQGRMEPTNMVEYGKRWDDAQPTASSMGKPLVEIVGQEVMDQAKAMIKPVKMYDLSDESTVQALFEEATSKENPRHGLLDDEVQYLTIAERDTLAKKHGYEYEQPYPVPMSPNPFLHAYHIVLTNKNTIRQYLTPVDMLDTMRHDVHFDVLKPKREDKQLQRDENRMKTYTLESKGGVVFDRFAASKVVLTEGLKIAATEEDEEKRDVLVRQAFKNYAKQAEQDKLDDYSGKSKWLAEQKEKGEQVEGDEDFELPKQYQEGTDEIFKARTVRESVLTVHEIDELFAADVFNSRTVTVLGELSNLTPVINDTATVGSYSNAQALKIYNTLEEKELTDEELDFFKWKDEIEDEDAERNLTASEFVDRLRDRRAYIPAEIWERLNNQATETVNNAIKHVLGINGLTIDSFVEDYVDLLAYVAKHYSHLENLKTALSVMDGFVVTSLKVIHDADEYQIIDEDVDIDLVDARSIMSTTFNRSLHFPSISKSVGLTAEEVLISEESHYGMFYTIYEQLIKQFKARCSREDTPHPIHAVYVTFSDGAIYRAYPMLTKTIENSEAIFDFIKLVRLPVIF